MWTEITRAKYARAGLRYATDMTDAEWALIEPFLPPAKRGGRPRTTVLRDVVNALLYLLRGGCPWRMLPGDFPPRSTVQRYFYAWRDDGTWRRINHYFVMAAREADGREGQSERWCDRQPIGQDHGKRRVRAALTPARRSRAANATSLPIPAACWSAPLCTAPTSRTATGLPCCSPRSDRGSHGCAIYLPTAAMPALNCAARSRVLAHGHWRSSSAPTPPGASNFCPDDGLLSAPLRGSDATGAWPRTSRQPSPAPKPGSTSPASNSLSGASQHHDYIALVSSQTLRPKEVQILNQFVDEPFVITGIVFPEEVEYGKGKAGVGWLFLVTRRGFINGQPGPPQISLIRGERAGQQDIFARLPVAKALRKKRVFLIGCGAIGSFAAIELARAGVGKITLLDGDVVQPGNSLRWPMGRTVWGCEKIGRPQSLS